MRIVVPEKKFTLPALPQQRAIFPNSRSIVTDHTVEVLKRLHRAANEVKRLEILSLDPALTPGDERKVLNNPSVFHGFSTLGRAFLNNNDEIQKLLLSVTLSIAHGPAEKYECFDPRHGLRIYEQSGYIDVLLCYSCLQGVIYEEKQEMWFSTNNEAEPYFDSKFTELGLKKAK